MSIFVGGARHACLVPLDVQSLRHALSCMVRRVLCDEALDMSRCNGFALSDFELHVALVRDGRAWSANIQYLKCHSPTNVLSFPLHTPSSAGKIVPPAGDMLVAVDTLRREAFLYGQDVSVYAIALLAHGIAHLAGFSHGEGMTRFEQALIASITSC